MEDRELAEVRRILGELTERLRDRRSDLSRAAEILAEIDLVFAKAVFAREYDCCLPELNAGGELDLEEARHPLLERALRGQGRRPVPLTLRLDPSQKTLVISGPNTGGKTVVLKTIARSSADGAVRPARAGGFGAAARVRPRAGRHR